MRSARFAGPDATDEENLAKLMAEAPAGSALRYVCALAYVDPAAGPPSACSSATARGGWPTEARGTRGFGYDPAFLPDGDYDGRTMAELTDDEKDAISHRAGAVAELLAWLAEAPRVG